MLTWNKDQTFWRRKLPQENAVFPGFALTASSTKILYWSLKYLIIFVTTSIAISKQGALNSFCISCLMSLHKHLLYFPVPIPKISFFCAFLVFSGRGYKMEFVTPLVKLLYLKFHKLLTFSTQIRYYRKISIFQCTRIILFCHNKALKHTVLIKAKFDELNINQINQIKHINMWI